MQVNQWVSTMNHRRSCTSRVAMVLVWSDNTSSIKLTWVIADLTFASCRSLT